MVLESTSNVAVFFVYITKCKSIFHSFVDYNDCYGCYRKTEYLGFMLEGAVKQSGNSSASSERNISTPSYFT